MPSRRQIRVQVLSLSQLVKDAGDLLQQVQITAPSSLPAGQVQVKAEQIRQGLMRFLPAIENFETRLWKRHLLKGCVHLAAAAAIYAEATRYGVSGSPSHRQTWACVRKRVESARLEFAVAFELLEPDPRGPGGPGQRGKFLAGLHHAANSLLRDARTDARAYGIEFKRHSGVNTATSGDGGLPLGVIWIRRGSQAGRLHYGIGKLECPMWTKKSGVDDSEARRMIVVNLSMPDRPGVVGRFIELLAGMRSRDEQHAHAVTTTLPIDPASMSGAVEAGERGCNQGMERQVIGPYFGAASLLQHKDNTLCEQFEIRTHIRIMDSLHAPDVAACRALERGRLSFGHNRERALCGGMGECTADHVSAPYREQGRKSWPWCAVSFPTGWTAGIATRRWSEGGEGTTHVAASHPDQPPPTRPLVESRVYLRIQCDGFRRYCVPSKARFGPTPILGRAIRVVHTANVWQNRPNCEKEVVRPARCLAGPADGRAINQRARGRLQVSRWARERVKRAAKVAGIAREGVYG